MTDLFTLKYRPRRWPDLIGQPVTQALLARMTELGTLPPTMLFAGVRGCGKTSAARIVATVRVCLGQPEKAPCLTCVPCAVLDIHRPWLIEIDAASHGGVEAIRSLIADVVRTSSPYHRTIVLDECHSLSKEAFNVLLKIIEEPPANTTFVLITTQQFRIPETLLSRLMTFQFNAVPTAALAARLVEVADAETLTIEPELVMLIAEHARGGVRNALMLLDQCARAEVRTAAEFRELFLPPRLGTELLTLLVAGDLAGAQALVDEARTRVATSVVIEQLTEALRDAVLGRGVSIEAKYGLLALKVLWELSGRRYSEVSCDVALALVAQALVARR